MKTSKFEIALMTVGVYIAVSYFAFAFSHPTLSQTELIFNILHAVLRQW